jgi:hypothetical protein
MLGKRVIFKRTWWIGVAGTLFALGLPGTLSADNSSGQLKWRAPKFAAPGSDVAPTAENAYVAPAGTTEISFRVADGSENVLASAAIPGEKSVLRKAEPVRETPVPAPAVRRAAVTDLDLSGEATRAVPEMRSRLNTMAQRKKPTSDFPPDLDSDDFSLPTKPALPQVDEENETDFGGPEPRKNMQEEEPAMEITPPSKFRDREPRDRATENSSVKENTNCDEYRRKCRKVLEELRQNGIATVGLDIGTQYKFNSKGVSTGSLASEGVDYPCESTLGDEPFMVRHWSEVCFEWKASCLCHKPIYFEEVQVERYGHSCNPILQPVVHAVHFFGTLPILPYKMGLQPPRECVYALGYYRPGDCAPYVLDPIPINGRAAAWQGAAWTAAAFIIP